MRLAPLPDDVTALLAALNAPPRLVAHLTLVHDVARALTTRLDAAWPPLVYDHDAVWLGAALHDIGKVAHPDELSQPGHAHEPAGEALLRARDYPEHVARICVTHAIWENGAPEDLLVAAADHWWRGKRNESLEEAIYGWIAQDTRSVRWNVFATLDDIASAIAARADERLAWQGQFAANSRL